MLSMDEPSQLELLQERLPRRPYCKDEKDAPQRIRSLKAATRRRYIQANPPGLRFWMTFDVDRSDGALAWEDADLPEPAWAAVTPSNGHAHLAYGIEAPVLLADPDRRKPLKYLTAIERAYSASLEADPSYSAHMTKNPIHGDWRTLWGRQWLRGLDELADWVNLNRFKYRGPRGYEDVGLGRNCTLFDWTRKYAYRQLRYYQDRGGKGAYVFWQQDVYRAAQERNGDFPVPLPLSEVWQVAKSVSLWTWRHFDVEASDERWRRRQARRGAKGGSRKGEERRKRLQPEAIRLADEGYNQRQIAMALGVAQKTVSNWLR